jgi:hypothetical protein
MLGNFNDAIARLEAQKEAIDKAIAILRDFDGGGISDSAAPKKATAKKAIKKRVMSEAGRKAISDASKRYWAAKKKAAKKAA